MANRNPKTSEVISEQIFKLVLVSISKGKSPRAIKNNITRMLNAEFPTRRRAEKVTPVTVVAAIDTLPESEANALRVIAENPGKTAVDLAEIAGVPYGSFSPRVKPLRAKGLIYQKGKVFPKGRGRNLLFASAVTGMASA